MANICQYRLFIFGCFVTRGRLGKERKNFGQNISSTVITNAFIKSDLTLRDISIRYMAMCQWTANQLLLSMTIGRLRLLENQIAINY